MESKGGKYQPSGYIAVDSRQFGRTLCSLEAQKGKDNINRCFDLKIIVENPQDKQRNVTKGNSHSSSSHTETKDGPDDITNGQLVV